jgi:phosphoribosylformimino-5-aminoimidazole carboxamide ribotide isomerase
VEVIPVIDLKGGVVVHARRGERTHYAPLRSPLCAGSAPADVVRALLGVHPFAKLYVADLDAITGTGGHTGIVAELASTFPGLELWVDGGFADASEVRRWRGHTRAVPVVGTEVLRNADELRALDASVALERRRGARLRDWVLSLDWRGDAFCGDARVLEATAAWPGRVIVMTLARVGAAEGPDVERVRDVRERARDVSVYAAGGVRDGADLRALARIGVAGALVATALHAGTLTKADIEAVARP